MRQNYDPVEMHGSGTVVAASLVVLLAAVGLVFAFQTPAVAVVATGGILVATTARRLRGLWQRRREEHRTRQVCIKSIGVCIEV